MHRFFVTPDSIVGHTVTLLDGQAHQIARVLRLSSGDQITVLDNSGYEYVVALHEVSTRQVLGRIMERALSQSEPRTAITLYQALLKGSKFEYVLQKCTEVGVTAFVPLVCRRCVADAAKVSEPKLARWRDIIRESAEQSRRGRLPTLSPPMAFEEAGNAVEGLGLLPWEGEAPLSLRSVLRENLTRQQPLKVSLLIGPEGGFDPSEVVYARSHGVAPVTLGKRVLRAETAGLVAASAILYEMGDLGG